MDDPQGNRYVVEKSDEIAVRLDKYHTILEEIEKRGCGKAQVDKIATKINKRVGKNLHCYNALGEANDSEKPLVIKSIAEWSDADSIAAHYGYGNDYFCTEDRASSAGSASVLHPDNRKWIQEKFEMEFVSLTQLAAMI